MVAQDDAKLFAGFLDLPGHFHVALGRRWIAARVIVGHDDRGGAQIQRPLDDLSRIDRGVIHRAFRQHFVGDQHIFTVEEKHPELLVLDPAHGRPAMVQQRLPG